MERGVCVCQCVCVLCECFVCVLCECVVCVCCVSVCCVCVSVCVLCCVCVLASASRACTSKVVRRCRLQSAASQELPNMHTVGNFCGRSVQ